MSVAECRQRGFTLIELIVGLVVTAIALAYLTSVFFSAPQRSVEPLLQIRAAELGQSLMDEIITKAYDEVTPLGGMPPCSPCTAAAGLGPDGGENRSNYDDVDDYHAYCNTAPPYANVVDAFGNAPNDFANFRMSVCVSYDGDYDGSADASENAKLVIVDVSLPPIGGSRQQFRVKAWRGNF